MKRILPLLVLSLLAVGCAPRQTVDATALYPVLGPVLDRHDAYVNLDPSLVDVERATFLRSSELVRETLNAAMEMPLDAPLPDSE